jgi:ATP-binding cassette subfamily B multidrug efflux pump
VKNLRSLNHFFVKYKWHFLGGLLFVFLSCIFKVYQGVVVREGSNSITSILQNKVAADTSVFVRHGLILIGLALSSGFFLFLMRQTIIVMSRHIEYDQKNEIYAHYQKLDQSFFKQHTTGDLMNRISEDVGKVRMYTGPAIMYLANTIATTVTVLGFMMTVNMKLTLVVFIPLPFLSILIYFVSDRINRQGTIVQEELGHITTQAQESFSAIRVIKAYAREKYFEKEMQNKSAIYKKASLKMANIEALFSPVMMLMIGSSVLLTVWYGGHLAMKGEIAPGNIPEFILYVYFMTWPFASLGWVTSLIQRASASQKRIDEFLKREPKIINKNNSVYEIKGAIEFKNVSFTYPENGIVALKNVSFKIEPGEILGVSGPVGSGKSSLLTLLTRQYDVNEGEILIDGKNIKEHNIDILRKSFGSIPQEVFLFSDTISGNISFGTEKEVSEKEIEEAADRAGVLDNILTFPDKFRTLVGERGVTLSGGQKQRISIARALITKPKVLLLDDCLSAVDTETEEKILSGLNQSFKGRTGIIISHRITSLRSAGKILYLKNGEVSEYGTHDELVRAKKDYHKLYLMQSN